MKWIFVFLALAIGAAGFIVLDYFLPGALISNFAADNPLLRSKTTAERIAEAEARSAGVKGVYMTSTVANDSGRAAVKLRNDILKLIDETELNALVIDVKETEGGLVITDRLKELIAELHRGNVWVIARQVVFKDDSQEKAHPEWYLKRTNGAIWRDNRSGSWLDPASPDVWAYQLSAAKAASDAGFDEIQFDYIRFPSDGDVENAIYPVYDSRRPKYEVLRQFFTHLHDGLKSHRPDLILSADLFGYAAIHRADLGIGQRLKDIGQNFDYVSLMVYPSHYYAGFETPADPARNLAAVAFPYRAPDMSRAAISNPYEVVYRSLLIAGDILAGRATATDQIDESPISSSSPPSRARLRPWLQDFDLAVDSDRGIRYDAAKVRAQIDAAEAAGASGWLLWSPDNVYTKEALRPAPQQ